MARVDLAGEVNPGGTQLNYTYYALNRLTKVTYPGGSTLTYTYDKDGNILTMVNSAVSDYYTYDALNRVTNETEVISGHAYTTLYAYDRVGNVKSMVYPGGTNITMTYDFENRLTKVGSLATISYTLDSMIGSILYGNGQNTTYTYNVMDRPTQIDVKSSTGVKLMDLNYTYDNDGNIKSVNNQNYTYNWLNELTSASGSWGTTTYVYDPTGNMLNQTTGGVTTKYIYGSDDELMSIGNVNFTYDGNGNTHTVDNGSTLWTYNYDYNNRLDLVEKNGVTAATYSYDGNGMLVQSIESNTQVFAYQGDNRIFAENTGTGSVADYIYGNGLLLASLNGSATDYYHEDALGSIMLVSSSMQSTLFSTNYEPYGTTLGATGWVTFEYTGMATDAVTGLDYASARWYDPASRRFMTEDSVTGNQYSPLSLNRYIYADDNPMTLLDPTGHMIASGGKVVAVVTKSAIVEVAPAGDTVVTAVTAVPATVSSSTPSTPSVTPSNVAPQTSTNTASSPPSNSLFTEEAQQAIDSEVSGNGIQNAAYEPSTMTTTTSNTPTSVQSTSTSENSQGLQIASSATMTSTAGTSTPNACGEAARGAEEIGGGALAVWFGYTLTDIAVDAATDALVGAATGGVGLAVVTLVPIAEDIIGGTALAGFGLGFLGIGAAEEATFVPRC